jgi:hypothetical protein
MLGDFNECMWQQEHFSASCRREKQMKDFREALSFCDLHDLGFKGGPWTYDNNQDVSKNVKVRLDCAVASPDWSSLFPNNQVVHLTSSRSDHCPILLFLDNYGAVTRDKPMRRYEVYWERETSLGDEIEQAWAMYKSPRIWVMLPII